MIRDLSMQLSNKILVDRISSGSSISADLVIERVIHFQDKENREETFHKTALAWANENDDPISLSDLLHLEYTIHPTLKEGLESIKKQLTNDKLLYWITRTFSRYYQRSPALAWCRAIFISLFQLGLSYFFFIFDVYTDIQLTSDYKAAYSDIDAYTNSMLECARANVSVPCSSTSSCFNVAHEYPDEAYYIAYCLTWASLVLSLFSYGIGILFIFNMDNLTEKFLKKNGKDEEKKKTLNIDLIVFYIKKILLGAVIRICWPILHIYRKIRYERSEQKSSRRKKFIEFETIWIMVRTIEHGIEATVQLLIVLYLLVPYLDEIHCWDFQTKIKKSSYGVFHFITMGHYQACLLEKVLGKLFINIFAQALSMSVLKYIKYGMSLNDHITNMIPIYASYLLQIFGRLYALRVFFVTAEELMGTEHKGDAIIIFFIIHFTFVLIIKFTFEVRRRNFCVSWLSLKFWMKFFINFLSSCLIYVQTNEYGTKPREDIHDHNSLLPQVLFQFLILVEHLVLVIFPLSLSKTDCLDQETYIFTAYTVPILWLISNISLIFHYKGCHTWKETNGPKFEIKKSNQDDTLQIQNTPDELRNHSNFKSQTCNVMNNFEISCFTYTCCSENTLKIIFNRNCFKTERNELENRIYKSQFEMSSVEPLIQSCNSMVLE